jgi:hypothetical protein
MIVQVYNIQPLNSRLFVLLTRFPVLPGKGIIFVLFSLDLGDSNDCLKRLADSKNGHILDKGFA